jgi:PKHD-type hydroxylase
MPCSLFEIGLWGSVFSEEQIKEINKTVLNVAEPVDEFGGLTQAAGNARKTSTVTRFSMGTLRNEIYKKISDAVIETNKLKFGYDLFPITEYDCLNYNVYNKGDEYEWHTDGQKDGDFDIKLTCLINLSEIPYKGGELMLGINQGKGFGMKMEEFVPGSVLIFSPHVYHRVTPVTEGRRITASLWATGPKFR